jgi:hypothetical protein
LPFVQLQPGCPENDVASVLDRDADQYKASGSPTLRAPRSRR